MAKITKIPTPPKKGRGHAKKIPATSKNGVFGKILQNFGPKGASATAMSTEVEVIVPPAERPNNDASGASTSKLAGTPVQKRRGTFNNSFTYSTVTFMHYITLQWNLIL